MSSMIASESASSHRVSLGRWLAASCVVALGISGCAADASDVDESGSAAIVEDEFVAKSFLTPRGDDRFPSQHRSSTHADYWKVLLVAKKAPTPKPFVVLAAYDADDNALYEAVMASDTEQPALEFRTVDGKPLSLEANGKHRVIEVGSLEVDLDAVASDWSSIVGTNSATVARTSALQRTGVLHGR